MSKVIHIRDVDLIRALEDGAEIVAGQRRFLLVELHHEDPEDVTDPEEVALIEEALRDTSPRLSGEAAREYLKARLGEHGLG